ncbi:hypothetical protein ElyMa_000348700 [Elysia marginata]|uniref:Uncharacterized protein n=1 Tax=Elysia marginata TaxID=1093978 RepID=A0AAV4FEA9_9GAST|nr:hypothetical protein ElyMa_000348700 [Elysia marginata]
MPSRYLLGVYAYGRDKPGYVHNPIHVPRIAVGVTKNGHTSTELSDCTRPPRQGHPEHLRHCGVLSQHAVQVEVSVIQLRFFVAYCFLSHGCSNVPILHLDGLNESKTELLSWDNYNIRPGWESNPEPQDHEFNALSTKPRCS